MASVEWILRFPLSRIHHLDAFHSDHKPLLLCLDPKFKRFYRKGRPFRFEAIWLNDNSCEDVIRDSWDFRLQSGLVWGFTRKIMACQDNLKDWNRTTFGHVRFALKRKMAELKEAEEGDCYRIDPGQIQLLRKEIGSLQSREECMWKQRARNSWLKEGDRNIAYFHCRANQRNRRNLILGLEDDNGVWVEDETKMGGIEGYFKNIFSTSNPSKIDNILNGILHPVDVDVDPSVGGDFQAYEMKQALNQMAPNTAPGPDGMSPIFYKSFWHIVGEDVTAVVLQALNSSIVPESLNATFISLISKVKNPKKVSDFRPISLCNVVYKLIAKVVVNRLKKLLAKMIPDSQSAFLSGRLITDNILVAFETLHFLKRKTQGKLGYMALKLDMNKAYDMVE